MNQCNQAKPHPTSQDERGELRYNEGARLNGMLFPRGGEVA